MCTAKRISSNNRFRLALLATLTVFLLYLFSACIPQNITNTQQTGISQYGVFIGANPTQADSFSAYNLIVIDAAYFTKTDIDNLHQKGILVYAYLNIGSIEDFRDFFSDYQHLSIGRYENWPGEFWIDVSDQEWQKHIYAQAGLLVEKGVDGFFIDNTDVYYQYHTTDIFHGLITILNELDQYGKDILINGGDLFVSEAVLNADYPLVQITGVNQECVFTNIDFENKQLILQNSEDTAYYQAYLEKCRAKGLMVYLLEYSDKDKFPSEINEYCRLHQFNYYISPSIDLR